MNLTVHFPDYPDDRLPASNREGKLSALYGNSEPILPTGLFTYWANHRT